MTVTESKSLKKGSRVYWQGDAADSGIVAETSWDAVTIAWQNGERGQSTPRRHARDSANSDEAAYCVTTTEPIQFVYRGTVMRK
jgi:hypothetical protein